MNQEQEWEQLRKDVARAQGMQETTQQFLEMTKNSLEHRVLQLERDLSTARITQANEMGSVARSLEMVAKSYDTAVKIHDFHLVRVLSICNTILIVVFGAVALFMRMTTR